MAITDDMINAIQASLGGMITPSLTSSSALGDLFEGYILSILLDAATELGGQIEYRNISGTTNQFLFRTSPGFIFSTAQAYTYAVIAFSNCPVLEAHVGVRVAGKSDVLHECDLAVLPQAEAQTCRQNMVHPRSAKLILAIECKFYTVSLPLDLARSFVGLGVDLSATGCYFVTNTASEVIERLLAHHSRHWEHNVFPQAQLNVNRLRNSFQKAFVNSIAKNR